MKKKSVSFAKKWTSIIGMTLLSLIYNHNSLAQINVTDSIGLVSLYNTTNGPNWYNHTNWLTGPVSTWFGIQTSGSHRVRIIILYNNNLSGYLSEQFFGLDSLYHLNLGKNNLSGTIPAAMSSFSKLTNLVLFRCHFTSPIPLSLGSISNLHNLTLSDNDFSGTIPDTLLKNNYPSFIFLIDTNHFNHLPFVSSFSGALYCRNNNLTFEDVLPYLQGASVQDFRYYPQDSIGNSYDTTVTVGDTLILNSWCGGPGNAYRWKRGATYVTSYDTLSTLTLNNIQLNQSGYYTCEVVNDSVPLLTLNRKIIHVLVNNPDAIPIISNNNIPLITFNPENDFLRLQLRFPSKIPVKSCLYDMMGRKVMLLYDDNTSYQDLHYYLNWLKSGIYLVSIQYSGIQQTTKILIK